MAILPFLPWILSIAGVTGLGAWLLNEWNEATGSSQKLLMVALGFGAAYALVTLSRPQRRRRYR
jgi:hypothetical protein